MTPEELASDLMGFYGTEHWYTHPLNRLATYTDGVKYFADTVGAHWLLDIIVTEPAIIDTMVGGFAVIELSVAVDGKAVITCGDGDDHVTFKRNIDWTDCPVGKWAFFFVENVVMLPSEY